MESQSAVLDQVKQLWCILDDLSQNHPADYKTFIESQIRERADYYSPQPHCCLRTSLQKPEDGILYVNICGWKQVPAPTAQTQPVPVCGGMLETVAEEKVFSSENYCIVEVAFNPDVLQKADGDPREKEQIHLLTLSFIQQQHKLSLSQNFTVIEAKLKGNVQDMTRRLTTRFRTKSSTPNQQTDLTPSLLQQISSLRMEETKEDSTISIGRQEEGKARSGLIEVISSTESVQPQQPKHQTLVYSDSSDSTRSLKLRVELPGVCSVSQCQLSITQDDLLLEVEEQYYLHLQFPEAVNEETCRATYNKKKQVLTITASIL